MKRKAPHSGRWLSARFAASWEEQARRGVPLARPESVYLASNPILRRALLPHAAWLTATLGGSRVCMIGQYDTEAGTHTNAIRTLGSATSLPLPRRRNVASLLVLSRAAARCDCPRSPEARPAVARRREPLASSASKAEGHARMVANFPIVFRAWLWSSSEAAAHASAATSTTKSRS